MKANLSNHYGHDLRELQLLWDINKAKGIAHCLFNTLLQGVLQHSVYIRVTQEMMSCDVTHSQQDIFISQQKYTNLYKERQNSMQGNK